LGQRVENQFLGLSTGIMDQFISRCGKANHGLFLNCRNFEYQLIPVAFPNAVFVIANTCCARGLTQSKYNERVAECGEAVRGIKERKGGTGTHLRDFTLADLSFSKDAMSDVAFRRARHIITENDRTVEACKAMRNGDAGRLGALMNASDESLRMDYEVTSFELDTMTAIARALPGCYGARMTGAGFGGCTINLVAEDKAEAFGAALMAKYAEETGIQGEIITSKPDGGAGILE
jgi:galactokinase